ncbi:hypothetical protein FGO68_gene4141 [Halteria grandinella]|uniref:Uncharacterized protein n=1 Tax=Halteria grandinella TaxID=5974 RepID=A0A8J8NX36_HALGN|nr:hypothetical protein FGO68_gene4141 [Halteria grandinella]
MMSTPADDSVESFLINECRLQRLQGSYLAFLFFKNIGFTRKQQLLAFLPNLSVTDLIKLGLLESEAAAIMRHSNKTILKRTINTAFPRLANKYIILDIVGWACVQPEAVDLGYLCHSFRLFLIRNYQLMLKMGVIMAEKKVITNIFELLDERWLSKRYRLTYQGYNHEKDVADCLALLGDRLHFHYLKIQQSLLPIFSKRKPIKVKIETGENISQFFKDLPHSVTQLTVESFQVYEDNCGDIRKFRKLKM